MNSLKTSLYKLLAFLIILYSAISQTNSITYKDIADKELTITQLEDLYYLNILNNKKINARLTGRNLFDNNNFNNIDRVRTYTTIKISF